MSIVQDEGALLKAKLERAEALKAQLVQTQALLTSLESEVSALQKKASRKASRPSKRAGFLSLIRHNTSSQTTSTSSRESEASSMSEFDPTVEAGFARRRSRLKEVIETGELKKAGVRSWDSFAQMTNVKGNLKGTVRGPPANRRGMPGRQSVVNPDLYKTLQQYAKEGRVNLYGNPVAEKKPNRQRKKSRSRKRGGSRLGSKPRRGSNAAEEDRGNRRSGSIASTAPVPQLPTHPSATSINKTLPSAGSLASLSQSTGAIPAGSSDGKRRKKKKSSKKKRRTPRTSDPIADAAAAPPRPPRKAAVGLNRSSTVSTSFHYEAPAAIGGSPRARPPPPTSNRPVSLYASSSPLADSLDFAPSASSMYAPPSLGDSELTRTPTSNSAYDMSDPLSGQLSTDTSSVGSDSDSDWEIDVSRFNMDTEKKTGIVYSSDSSDEEEDEVARSEKTYKWNLKFQFILNRLRSQNVNTNLQERIDTNLQLLHLSQDFIYAAQTYGKIIISEVFVKPRKKTIPPASIGGAAGGDKYIVQGILFKFAVDSSGLFQGDNQAAMKVAGHELKGLVSYFSLEMSQINMPLMVLVDYRGFRLIAMSLLPIGKDTLIYGSNDAGQTVHCDKPDFSKLMQRAGEMLNLRAHWCGWSEGSRKELWAATDVEGHYGTDNQYYLLDFSRTLPPTKPDPRMHNGHLFQLMRKEFVQSNPVPLVSDAFSGFVMTDPAAQEYNADVMDATERLINGVIPSFSKRLVLMTQEALNHGTIIHFAQTLPAEIHRDGINLRYIGYAYRTLDKMEMGDTLVCKLLLIEAVARVLKNNLAYRLRNKMRELRLPSEVPYNRLAVEFVNLVFGSGDESQAYWGGYIKEALNKYFNFDFDLEDDEPGLLERDVFFTEKFASSTRTMLDGSKKSSKREFTGRYLLFKRFTKMTGLQFADSAKNKFKGTGKWNHREPVGFLDLKNMEERVTPMNIIANAEATFFHCRGLEEDDRHLACELYQQAIDKYTVALSWTPRSKQVLLASAVTMYAYLESREMSRRKSILDPIAFNMQDPMVVTADTFFLRANDAGEGKDPIVLCAYGLFLEKCQRNERAEDFFLRSLEANPNYLFGNLAYGLYLCNRGKDTEANYFLQRGAQRNKLGQMAVSPVTGTVPGSRIRIYLEDKTFKTVHVTVGMETNEIEDRLAEVLLGRLGTKKQFTPAQLIELRRKYSQYSLFERIELVSNHNSLASSSAGASSGDSGSASGAGSTLRKLAPDKKPWLIIERPRSTSSLLFKKDESAKEDDASSGVVLSDKPESAASMVDTLEKLQGKVVHLDNIHPGLKQTLQTERAKLMDALDQVLQGNGKFNKLMKGCKWDQNLSTAAVILQYRLVSLLFGVVRSYCDCPTMTASPDIEYRLATEEGSCAVSATAYIVAVLNSTEEQLNSHSSLSNLPALDALKVLTKRLLRTFGHIYYRHWHRLTAFGLEHHARVCFAFCYSFSVQSRFLDKKLDATTLDPVQKLTDAIKSELL